MNADPFANLKREFYCTLRPAPRLDLADWVEKHVRLPSTVAAESGRMKLLPWQREVARSISDPLVERVTLLKSARVGATQLMVAGIGHYALNDPALQLVVMPSESDCRMLMANVIEPTFAASPTLRDALTENVSGRDNMLSRHYPGGTLSLVSGASPKNLRARTARVLWLDEVDGLDLSAGEEGDPVALAIRRTMTFGSRRKIVMASTPVDEATSRIARAYEEGDCRVWELPCLHCGGFHELKWSMIQWPTGKPEEAYFACPTCGGVTDEHLKPKMIEQGRWRPTKPEVTGHHSYRLNTFGSSALPTAAWGILAAEFVAAKKDPALLKTWVNTVAGEVWRDESDGMEAGSLLERREPFDLERVPEDVIAITGGADVQRDRVELATIGWTADDAALVLSHEIVWGDPLEQDVWREVDSLIKRTFRHPKGGTLRYDSVLIDSGDGVTVDAVYKYTRGEATRRVFPCKGLSGFREKPVRLGKAAGDKSIRLQLVGVDGVKRRIMHMVTGGSFRFSESLDDGWFDQFTGERLRTRYRKGVPSLEWHRYNPRVEAWDCCVYGVAARSLINLNIEAREAEVSSPAAPKKVPAISRSRWLSGQK